MLRGLSFEGAGAEELRGSRAFGSAVRVVRGSSGGGGGGGGVVVAENFTVLPFARSDRQLASRVPDVNGSTTPVDPCLCLIPS